jgi:hypothetical protein
MFGKNRFQSQTSMLTKVLKKLQINSMFSMHPVYLCFFFFFLLKKIKLPLYLWIKLQIPKKNSMIVIN